MGRAAKEYVLRINLKSGTEVRRFCEVHVNGDDVYVFQPEKGAITKVSYHQSGQRHLKKGAGPAMFTMFTMMLDRPRWIETEEPCWEKSFENFARLFPYCSEPATDIFEIDLPNPSDTTISFAQVSIGRFFSPPGWELDGGTLTTPQQRVFPVPSSPSDLSICVRVLQLAVV